MYHENAYSPQQFTIVVKDEEAAAKIFDNFEYIGSESTFSRYTFENSGQSIEEYKLGNRNYKYRNRRWFANFPKIEREMARRDPLSIQKLNHKFKIIDDLLSRLFPLYGTGRFGGDVINDPVDTFHPVDNPVGNPCQHFIGDP